jgi:hypothetical protein
MKIAFEKGELEMHCAYGLRVDGMFDDNVIRKFLENGL